jgi:hypothetical protein
MKKLNMMLFAVILSTVAGGCVVRGTMRSSAYVETPDMVALDSGVYVVQDYDQPVFYSDSYYWRYDGGVWYRSGYYNRGWVRVSTVPYRVRTIDRPYAYVHYRGSANVRHDNGWHGSRPHEVNHGEVRREERHERNQERHEERREERHDDHVREHRNERTDNGNHGHIVVKHR